MNPPELPTNDQPNTRDPVARVGGRWSEKPTCSGPLLFLIGFVLALYTGFTLAPGARTQTEFPGSYYAHLAEGFLRGHTHLAVEPDPRLAELANPYAGYQGVPRWHDATYYKGLYYLYFGASPAVVAVGPWAILTGYYLTDNGAVLLFSSVGFLLGCTLWISMVRRLVPSLGAGWVHLGVLLIGLGNFVILLMQSPAVYQVPISCAYAALMGAFLALWNAYGSAGREARVLWFLGASFAWSVAIGARPNYLYSLPVLGLFGLWAAWADAKRAGRWTGFATLPVLAVVAPAFLAGLALLAYNYARFGDVAEFGVHYQLAAFDVRTTQLFGTAHVAENITRYLLDPCLTLRYFPFVAVSGDSLGILWWAPFALLSLALPFTWLSSAARGRPGWIWVGVLILGVSLAQFAGLVLIPFRSERYQIDFVPGLTLAALLVMAHVATAGVCRPVWRWAGLTVAAIAACVTLAAGLLLALDRSPWRARLEPLARFLNQPSHLVERVGGVEFGPVSGVITFQDAPIGTREPLVVTSHGRDILFAERLPENRVRFGFIHLGTITPYSDPISIALGKLYPFTFDLGSLYPVSEHPLLAGFSPSARAALQRRVRVTFDGRVALDTASSFYPNTPSLVQFGANQQGRVTAPRLSGTLSQLRRAGVPKIESLDGAVGSGPVRLRLRFPDFQVVLTEPLLSTGAVGKGDLVFVTYVAPGRLRLGHDSQNYGAVHSRTVSFDPAVEHTIDIDAPHLGASGGEQAGRISLYFDGKLVLRTQRKFWPSSNLDLAFGYNASRSSAASELFTGPSLKASRIPDFKGVEPARLGWGAVRVTVMLPQGRAGANEPLLTTGVAGKGNFVYLRYLSDTQIQVGYDHWGIGGTLSEPVTIDPNATNQFDISVGSLYPDLADPWWQSAPERPSAARGIVLVKLNDEVVLNAPFAAHPAEPARFSVGANDIGGSTCGPAFTGEIQAVEPIPVPSEIR